MSKRQIKISAVKSAAQASVIEALETRICLTACTTVTGQLDVTGDDGGVGNNILLKYNSGTSRVEVYEGTTMICNPSRISIIRVFGGSGETATNTGADTITIDSSMPSTLNTHLYGLDGNDSITGGLAIDEILGGDGSDLLDGAGNNDTVQGDANDDTCYGGSGSDHIYGNDGNDVLGAVSGGNQEAGNDYFEGGAGSDVIDGGNNNDTIWGDGSFETAYGAADTIHGGADRDEVMYVGRSGDVNITLNDNLANDGAVDGSRNSLEHDLIYDDVEDICSGNGNDWLVGNDLGNSIKGDLGNDTIRGLGGADTIRGDNGNDWVDYGERASNDPLLITLDGNLNDGSSNGSEGDWIWNTIENVLGGWGNDTITGDDQNNILIGNNGDDTVSGGLGNDFLRGQGGDDSLVGGDGNDTLIGDWDDTISTAAGADTIKGGDGTDFADYSAREENLVITLNDATANDGAAGEGDWVEDTVELITTGTGNDSVTGSSVANTIHGGMGRDSLYGGDGNDLLYADSIYGSSGGEYCSGGNGADQIWGADGDDALAGDDGADEIWGNAGNDVISGGTGDDSLRGGSGQDSLFGEAGDDYLYDYTDNATDGMADFLDGGTHLNEDHHPNSEVYDTYVNFP